MNCHSPFNYINADKEKKTLYPFKDQFRCMFCGGQKCPHENYLNNKNTAMIGLNCDLIDNCIYASQRPSNALIKKYNLIQIFRNNNIGLIVNLQRPGEHPYCGPNMLDKQSGYSYTPSLFVSEGIKVRLSGWKDMAVPDNLYFMLDIIKEMTLVIKVLKMKVLVHCHSGYGRTGIVIACFKVFNDHLTAKEAVRQVREKRPKSIEKKSQMKYCYIFSECKYNNNQLTYNSNNSPKKIKRDIYFRENRYQCLP